jgi:hypothetical protein
MSISKSFSNCNVAAFMMLHQLRRWQQLWQQTMSPKVNKGTQGANQQPCHNIWGTISTQQRCLTTFESLVSQANPAFCAHYPAGVKHLRILAKSNAAAAPHSNGLCIKHDSCRSHGNPMLVYHIKRVSACH